MAETPIAASAAAPAAEAAKPAVSSGRHCVTVPAKAKDSSALKTRNLEKPITGVAAEAPAEAPPANVRRLYQIIKLRNPDGTIVRAKRPIKFDDIPASGSAARGATIGKLAMPGAPTVQRHNAPSEQAATLSPIALLAASHEQPESQVPTLSRARTPQSSTLKGHALCVAEAATASAPSASAGASTQSAAPTVGTQKSMVVSQSTAASVIPNPQPVSSTSTGLNDTNSSTAAPCASSRKRSDPRPRSPPASGALAASATRLDHSPGNHISPLLLRKGQSPPSCAVSVPNTEHKTALAVAFAASNATSAATSADKSNAYYNCSHGRYLPGTSADTIALNPSVATAMPVSVKSTDFHLGTMDRSTNCLTRNSDAPKKDIGNIRGTRHTSRRTKPEPGEAVVLTAAAGNVVNVHVQAFSDSMTPASKRASPRPLTRAKESDTSEPAIRTVMSAKAVAVNKSGAQARATVQTKPPLRPEAPAVGVSGAFVSTQVRRDRRGRPLTKSSAVARPPTAHALGAAAHSKVSTAGQAQARTGGLPGSHSSARARHVQIESKLADSEMELQADRPATAAPSPTGPKCVLRKPETAAKAATIMAPSTRHTGGYHSNEHPNT